MNLGCRANLARFQPSEVLGARYNRLRVFPFMAVLNTLMRWRRGESLVLAALLLACLFLPAAAQGAVLAGQNAQAVTLWLQAEMSLAQTPRVGQTEDPRSLCHRDNASI